ncbi:hypothetical protein [Rhizobium grahamii]|nr:hypothetical protein [Rhizobium grahamii]
MPGTFSSLFIVVFDRDFSGDVVPVWETVVGDDEPEALEEAKLLAMRHAGVIVWRESLPVDGKEGDPIIVFQSGAIGDIDWQ